MQWFIFGTGPHARKVHQALAAGGGTLLGFIDEAADVASPVPGAQVLTLDRLPVPQHEQAIIVAIGRPDVRRRVMQRLAERGWSLPALVHPRAWVAPDAHLGPGVFVAAHAVIETGSTVGRGSIVDVGVLVDHDCQIGEFCHLRAGEVLQPGDHRGLP